MTAMRDIRLTLIEERLNRRDLPRALRELESQCAMATTDIGELAVEVRRLRVAVEAAFFEGWESANADGFASCEVLWAKSRAKQAVKP